MKVAVKDSCLLIDLETMGILDLWFQLKIETLTINLIISELEEEHPGMMTYIDSGSITVIDYDVFELDSLFAELRGSGVSIQDVSVLHLAEEKDAMLLTCDGDLRHQAEQRTIECHGSIWVLDQLVMAELLTGITAVAKLKQLMSGADKEERYIAHHLATPFIKKWEMMAN